MTAAAKVGKAVSGGRASALGIEVFLRACRSRDQRDQEDRNVRNDRKMASNQAITPGAGPGFPPSGRGAGGGRAAAPWSCTRAWSSVPRHRGIDLQAPGV